MKSVMCYIFLICAKFSHYSSDFARAGSYISHSLAITFKSFGSVRIDSVIIDREFVIRMSLRRNTRDCRNVFFRVSYRSMFKPLLLKREYKQYNPNQVSIINYTINSSAHLQTLCDHRYICDLIPPPPPPVQVRGG